MIHTNRIVTVGEQECIIDRPIVLYRGDREVEIEFTLVGNEFTFSEDGNVIKSVNASHGQLVLNTPSGEHMFSELAECHEGKVVFVVTKEMIDEFIEMGFYSFQIRLYDSAEMKSRVTIPPVMNGFDIRNPIAAEDETNVVDQGIVDYARIFKDQSNEELPTFDWQGNYNKTEWAHHDLITENKMNKIEDALYSINANIKESDVVMLNALDKVKKDADAYVKEHMAEVEADVEDFERELNTDVQQFKIDTNAAMTAHKNEVSEVIDDFDAQLTDIENNNINIKYKTAKSLGIYPNMPKKETEFSSILQDFLLQYATDYIIFFDKGTYYLSDINVSFNKDTIISLQGVSTGTAMQDVKTIIDTRGKNFIKDTSTSCCHRINASDMRFISSGQQGKCFSSTGATEFNFKFNNIFIGRFDVGFEAPQWSCGGSGGENITFHDNRTGATLGLSSHLFYARNLSLNHNRLGIDFKNGGNNATIESVHIATGYSGSDKDDFDEFIGIKTNGGLIINGLYTEDYVGGGAYQAYKQIAIDYAYKGYGLQPLVCNGVNINHAEGSKQDKGIRFTQVDTNNNLQRFFTDKLIMNNVQTFDMTAASLPSEFQQLGILINGENMYNDKAGTILFNRPKYTLNKKNFILKKGFGIAIDSISWHRMKFGDDDSLAKQCDIYYENRVNKDLIPIRSEFISLLYTDTFLVKLKMDIFTENNEASYINCKLTNFATTIVDIKALKTPYGYKIDFEGIIKAPNDSGFQYFAICFDGVSSVWNCEADLYLDIEQVGSCRNR